MPTKNWVIALLKAADPLVTSIAEPGTVRSDTRARFKEFQSVKPKERWESLCKLVRRVSDLALPGWPM